MIEIPGGVATAKTSEATAVPKKGQPSWIAFAQREMDTWVDEIPGAVWLAWGEPLDTQKRGAVVVFRREGGLTRGHVGFYWGPSKDRILVLGGNQSNQVSIKGYKKEDLLELRWPLSG